VVINSFLGLITFHYSFMHFKITTEISSASWVLFQLVNFAGYLLI